MDTDDKPNLETLVGALMSSLGIVKAMPVERADKTGGIYSSISSYEDSGSYNKRSTGQTCAFAIDHIEKLFFASQEIHQRNLPAIENNDRLRRLIAVFMKETGIKDSYQEKKVTGRTRTKTTWVKHVAGYVYDINRDIVTGDGFAVAESTRREQLARIESYRVTGLAKEEKERKEKEAAEIARKEAEGLLPELEVMARHGEDICYGDHPDFELASRPTFVEEWRWGNVWDVTVRSKKTGKLYAASYRTASGDGGGFQDCNGTVKFTELEAAAIK